MIANRSYVLDWAGIATAGGLLPAAERAFTAPPLRWSVSAAGPAGVTVEATEYEGPPTPPLPPPAPVPPDGTDVVVSVVPTGIGCEIGGYAGDAGPSTALLAACADYVVTNPNAVNASNFVLSGDRILYTEGYCLDLFCRGQVNLYRPRANRVGLVVERADVAAVDEVLNVTNAVRAVHGVDVVDHVVTDRPIGTRCTRQPSGAYVGTVDHPEVLLAAAERLLASGADAIAVTTNVRDLPAEAYASHFQGRHPNPVGGAEAVVSHLVAAMFHVPAAHAPMANFKPGGRYPRVVDARSAGEYVSASGLACVLVGLHRAPAIVPRPGRLSATVAPSAVVAVVAPAGAVGGIPVLHALRRGIPVVAVTGNGTILDVTARALRLDGVVEVRSYAEAAGVVMALRGGIALDSLRRPLEMFGAGEEAAGETA